MRNLIVRVWASESDDRIPQLPHENIYGHLNRVYWFRRHIRPDDHVLEVGCGTGNRVALPLHMWGYAVLGIDIDHASITAGREHFARVGLDPSVLRECELDEVAGEFDVIIVSEVLEHLSDDELDLMLAKLRAKLKPQGRLLVTVPNGYGWFEAESFLWHKTGLGFLRVRADLRESPVLSLVGTACATLHLGWNREDARNCGIRSNRFEGLCPRLRASYRHALHRLRVVNGHQLQVRGALSEDRRRLLSRCDGRFRPRDVVARRGARSAHRALDYYCSSSCRT
jgi:SAM-dependent methyltransferase